ncbi:mitochondrial import inner membrane translocase subunit PAM16 like 2-like isoform X2 [Magnolia sinica]|uniref:mitochondrial import inner membrane translocase subunit PAM16 like 2-like isoform X2 n=1 Tax=Magnolia sinica TaxID=86752 RepID=UPI00265B69C3|nr:mitochondrial import inner membrane translocase subunit PAM16 like 2-like isoform X2 [Magnolia sinica]XP_058101715.1 mitochondrial import inner membrane translocase subunit PAM16 like 2-like isoform X2 [Magnolia sinica]
MSGQSRSRISAAPSQRFSSPIDWFYPIRAMASKILANLIVIGSGILARALVQAYRQALANASKTGVAQETIQNTVHRTSKIKTEQETRQILGVTEASSWEEIMKKYNTLFERNAKNGSFYLQSKVHKAKECLEAAHQGKGQGTG